MHKQCPCLLRRNKHFKETCTANEYVYQFYSCDVFENENICIKFPLNAKLFRDQVTVSLNGKEKILLTCVMRIETCPCNNLVCINTHTLAVNNK